MNLEVQLTPVHALPVTMLPHDLNMIGILDTIITAVFASMTMTVVLVTSSGLTTPCPSDPAVVMIGTTVTIAALRLVLRLVNVMSTRITGVIWPRALLLVSPPQKCFATEARGTGMMCRMVLVGSAETSALVPWVPSP